MRRVSCSSRPRNAVMSHTPCRSQNAKHALGVRLCQVRYPSENSAQTRGSKRRHPLSMVIPVRARVSPPCSLSARRSRALRISSMCTISPSAALQLRDEQALFDGWIEIAHQRTGAAVLAERHGAKPFPGQLLKALFREGHSLDVRRVEFMPRVTRPIHHDLYAHLVAPSLLLCGLSRVSGGQRHILWPHDPALVRTTPLPKTRERDLSYRNAASNLGRSSVIGWNPEKSMRR